MLAEIGRRADFALTRATDVVHEGAHATVLHLRRIVGAVSVAVVRVKREAEDSVRRRLDLEAGVRTLSVGTTRTLLALSTAVANVAFSSDPATSICWLMSSR